MDRRDRSSLDKRRQGLALIIIEFAWLARGLAVNQAVWPFGIEPKNPVADHLEADIANPGCILALSAIVNRRQGEQPAALARILR